MYPIVKIKKDRIISIRRRHPWVFSGGVLEHNHCSDGDIVEVQSQNGEFLAMAYFQEGSIMLRILSFEKVVIDLDFWKRTFTKAFHLRRHLGLPNEMTNAYRLLHGEGDGIPGLIIDIYNDMAVMQCHAIGIHKQISMITNAIEATIPGVNIIYNKSKNTLPKEYAEEVEDGFVKGSCDIITIKEYNNIFEIDPVDSQKTGFFLDQRENRKLLSQFTEGKAVLNLYCYTGGFSIYALNNGAASVVSIDSSRKAIEVLEKNVSLAKIGHRHEGLVKDVNQYLTQIESDAYDIIIVDPPAFAKSIRKKHNAIQAYKRVNAAAISKVKKGGMIFTFSCSQVIDYQLFYDTITAAAIETGRDCQVLYVMSQGADHPVNMYHPEGKYLKGLVLFVDSTK